MQHIHPKQSGFLLMCIEISPHVLNVFVIYTNWSMPSKWKCDFSFYLILIRMKWFYENIFFKCYLLFINMHVKQYIQFHIISLFQTNKNHKTIITNKINLDTDFTNSWSIEFIIFFSFPGNIPACQILHVENLQLIQLWDITYNHNSERGKGDLTFLFTCLKLDTVTVSLD